MPTPAHLRMIHSAARALRMNDAQYRTLLKNTGGVESAKDLTSAGVEDVMAVLEGLGFDGHPGGKTYWRDKVAKRGGVANERVVRLITMLAQQQRYCLPALAEQFSQGRTIAPEELTPAEAHKLIEMLKAVIRRDPGASESSLQRDASPKMAARLAQRNADARVAVERHFARSLTSSPEGKDAATLFG